MEKIVMEMGRSIFEVLRAEDKEPLIIKPPKPSEVFQNGLKEFADLFRLDRSWDF